ncbi:hypothetical protein [Phenylobacterium sp.]|uniref:hypothetical protein n=1 Tax=Phenylobacterium sp. TaxID=1871053 RepID=UPI0035B0D54E
MPATARLVLNEPAAPTSSLLDLIGQWEILHQEARDAWAKTDQAHDAALRILPDLPATCRNEQGHRYTREQLVALDYRERYLGHPSRVEAFDIWQAQTAAILGYFQADDLETAADAIQMRANDLAKLIKAMLPTDAHSAARKFTVLRTTYSDPQTGEIDEPAIFHGFQKDLDHLANVAMNAASTRR